MCSCASLQPPPFSTHLTVRFYAFNVRMYPICYHMCNLFLIENPRALLLRQTFEVFQVIHSSHNLIKMLLDFGELECELLCSASLGEIFRFSCQNSTPCSLFFFMMIYPGIEHPFNRPGES